MKCIARFTVRALLLGTVGGYMVAAAFMGVFRDWRWFAPLIAAALSVFAAAWFWRHTNRPRPAAAPREWRIWDTEIEDGPSDVERRMERAHDPVDTHAAQMIRALSGRPAVLPEIDLLLPGRRADLCNPYQEKRYFDGQGDQ